MPVTSYAHPKGFKLAQLQRGDVASTGLLLLEKIKQQENPVSGLFSAFSEIGRNFGVGEVNDYALFDKDSNRIYPLNISQENKTVSQAYNCERQNDVVNKCKNTKFYEALYEPNGNQNWGHYYWVLDWFNTPLGPMALLNTGTKAQVLDFKSGSKYTLFERGMGIQKFDVQRNGSEVSLSVTLGFDKKKIPNLIDYIGQNNPSIEKLNFL